MGTKHLYRCHWRDLNTHSERYDEQKIVVIFEELPVLKETQLCFWVYHNWKRRLVLKDQSGKRYAYTTKERALEAFIIKRTSYARRLKQMVKNNERLLKIANETATS